MRQLLRSILGRWKLRGLRGFGQGLPCDRLGGGFAMEDTQAAAHAAFLVDFRKRVLHGDSLNVRGAKHHAGITGKAFGIEALVFIQQGLSQSGHLAIVGHEKGIRWACVNAVHGAAPVTRVLVNSQKRGAFGSAGQRAQYFNDVKRTCLHAGMAAGAGVEKGRFILQGTWGSHFGNDFRAFLGGLSRSLAPGSCQVPDA